MFELKYIELKSGYNDNGPAWIGRVKVSRSGRTVYFNDHAFQMQNGAWAYSSGSNFFDVETKELYWISGVKKGGTDRHWGGSGYGRIRIARDAVEEYLTITGKKEIDTRRLEIVDIPPRYPVERIQKLLNEAAMEKEG